MKIYGNNIELTGNTPLVKLSRIGRDCGCVAEIYAKLESKNPGGSVKDRVALAMIEDAEQRGVLRPGGTIVEPTSGNTGIGLAWIGRLKGYRVLLTMPDTMSRERRELLRAYGAELELTPGKEGMKGAIARAEELKNSIDGAVVLGQFDNPANPAVHERTTAVEIFDATDGRVDILVAGVGTGGTVSGTGRGLKARKPSVEVVAVEPASSAVLSGGKAGAHKIQGIGAGFVPKNYDASVVDRVMTVSDEEAYHVTRLLAETESILAGISSGAALAAAIRLAQKPANAGKCIVVIMPDAADRYLSTGVYTDSSKS